MKRKSIRFMSEPVPYAAIDTNVATEFEPTISGLIFSESFTGCGVVSISDKIKEGQTIQIQINDHPVSKGRIAWVKSLEDNVIKFGVQYL